MVTRRWSFRFIVATCTVLIAAACGDTPDDSPISPQLNVDPNAPWTVSVCKVWLDGIPSTAQFTASATSGTLLASQVTTTGD